MYVNDVVNKQLAVRPLREGEVAYYKLLVADEFDRARVEEKTGKFQKNNPRRSLIGTRKIYDPIAKKQVTIQNVVSERLETMPDRTQKPVPVVERVKIPTGGIISVTYDQIGTYQFMERHPDNRDNPFRDKSKAPTFYRVNPIKAAIKQIEKDYVLTDALVHVREADEIELKSIYEGLDKSSKMKVDTTSFQTLKKGIFELAKTDPIMIMRKSKNVDVKIKIQIMEAEHLNVIIFEDGDSDVKSDRGWYWLDDKMTKIVDVDLTENKFDALVAHFNKDTKTYQKMALKLKEILSPKSGTVAV